MRPLFSKKSQAVFRRYCAGMLAVLLSVAYAVPSMAVCPCCDVMSAQPLQEASETDAPSCHGVVPTGDGTTEEIASTTEEIATQEIASCHESDAKVPAGSQISPSVSNGCGDDCMGNTPTVASPGIIDSHNSSNKVHSTGALSNLEVVNPYYLDSVSPVPPQTPAICPIHPSTASVPLRI